MLKPRRWCSSKYLFKNGQKKYHWCVDLSPCYLVSWVFDVNKAIVIGQRYSAIVGEKSGMSQPNMFQRCGRPKTLFNFILSIESSVYQTHLNKTILNHGINVWSNFWVDAFLLMSLICTFGFSQCGISSIEGFSPRVGWQHCSGVRLWFVGSIALKIELAGKPVIVYWLYEIRWVGNGLE